MINDLTLLNRQSIGRFTVRDPAVRIKIEHEPIFFSQLSPFPIEIDTESEFFYDLTLRISLKSDENDDTNIEIKKIKAIGKIPLSDIFLNTAHLSLTQCMVHLVSVISRAWKFHKFGSIKHAIFGSMLAQYAHDSQRLLYVKYENEKLKSDLLTLILQNGRMAHIFNIIDTDEGTFLKTRLDYELLKFDISELIKVGIERIQIHNVEMKAIDHSDSNDAQNLPNLKSIHWRSLSNTYLRSISPSGEFYGRIYSSVQAIDLEKLDLTVLASSKGTIEPVFNVFSQKTIDYLDDSMISHFSDTLFHYISKPVLTVRNLNQASALFQACLSNYAHVHRTLIKNTDVCGILKRTSAIPDITVRMSSEKQIDAFYHQLTFGSANAEDQNLKAEFFDFVNSVSLLNQNKSPILTAMTRVSYNEDFERIAVENCRLSEKANPILRLLLAMPHQEIQVIPVQ